MRAVWGIACIWLFTLLATHCSISSSAAESLAAKKLESAHLPNLFLVCDGIFSGGQPEGEEAFKELKALGVRTVISVDGARPNIELANKFQLRYVHLPLGYDGVSQERSKQLAKAISVLEPPIYFHCHHGRHRSPTAVAVACINLGRLSKPQGIELLGIAGTDRRYKGLFRSVENATLLSDETLRAAPAEFPAAQKLPQITESMVEIDQLFEKLRSAKQLNWKNDGTKAAATEGTALLLEHFRELPRLEDPRAKQESFVKICQTSEKAVKAIEGLLMSKSSLEVQQSERVSVAIKQLESQCTECHQLFRD